MKYELELTREQFEELCALKGWRLSPEETAARVDDVNSIDYSGSAGPHTHDQSDVTNLPSDLAGKASSSHTHPQSDVTNLVSDLAGKASSSHAHAQSDVTGLSVSLDGKSDTGHTHTISEVTSLQTTLDGKASSSHLHAISDTTGLQTALDGKASTSHTHAQADVTGLVTALSGKEATGVAAGLIATHEAASDPHTGYQRESEKAAANGYASLDGNTRVPNAQLGTGSPDSTMFLRGDRSWAVPAGGSFTPGRHLVLETGSTYGVRVDPRYMDIQDEFLGGTTTSGQVGKLSWILTSAGTAANSLQAGVSDHPGIFRLGTGATSGNNTRLHLGSAANVAVITPTQIDRFSFIVRIPTITTVSVRIGLGQDVSSATFGTAGAWFEFDAAVNANWRCITRQASTSNAQVSSPAVAVTANNWYLLEAVRLSGGNWEFYINGTLRATSSANQPTTDCNFGAMVQTATTAARNLDVDYASLRTIQLGNRFT